MIEKIIPLIEEINIEIDNKRSKSYLTGIDLDKVDQEVKSKISESLQVLGINLEDAVVLFLEAINETEESDIKYEKLCEIHSILLYFESI